MIIVARYIKSYIKAHESIFLETFYTKHFEISSKFYYYNHGSCILLEC